jgi:hypothetical protein
MTAIRSLADELREKMRQQAPGTESPNPEISKNAEAIKDPKNIKKKAGKHRQKSNHPVLKPYWPN